MMASLRVLWLTLFLKVWALSELTQHFLELSSVQLLMAASISIYLEAALEHALLAGGAAALNLVPLQLLAVLQLLAAFERTRLEFFYGS